MPKSKVRHSTDWAPRHTLKLLFKLWGRIHRNSGKAREPKSENEPKERTTKLSVSKLKKVPQNQVSWGPVAATLGMEVGDCPTATNSFWMPPAA